MPLDGLKGDSLRASDLQAVHSVDSFVLGVAAIKGMAPC